MKKLNKKAFTIVELVIVIAVIAILAAVLIPTFSNVIEKANYSSDIQVVRNMNTTLAIGDIDRNVDCVSRAQKVLRKNNFNSFSTKSSKLNYYWCEDDNLIYLVDDSVGLNVKFPENSVVDTSKLYKLDAIYTNTTILVKENQEINKDSCADIVTNSNGLLTNKNQITKIAFLGVPTVLDEEDLVTQFSQSQIVKDGDFVKYVIGKNDDEITVNFYVEDSVNGTKDLSNLFREMNIESIDFTSFDTSEVENMSDMFYKCEKLVELDLSNFNTSNVTNMSGMFYGCKNLETIDLSTFNTSNVTNMSSMFSSCESLSDIDLSNLNTANVTNMSRMFAHCGLAEFDLSTFNTSNVTNLSCMFYGCENLETIDLSTFNTSKVTNLNGLFQESEKLVSVNLSNFNTSLVTNISGMFQCCSSIEYVDLSSFDTSLVTDMSALFRLCSSLKEVDITNFTFRKNVNTMLFFSPKNDINKVYVKDETALNIVKGFGIKESKISIGHPIPC